jgi:sigma-E factor negative regulatory protein RseA
MSKHDLDEALSALMDGELPRDEAERVLDAVLAQPALRARWARYHQLGAALRGEAASGADGVATAVREALEREPVPLLVRAGTARRRPAVWLGLALAASLAAVAVLVVLGPGPEPGIEPLATAPVERPPTRPAPGAAPAAGGGERMAWQAAGPGLSKRLNAYLLDHSDYLSDGVHGLLAYARVVGYDDEE